MTSSKTLKKIFTLGVASLLAIGGSLGASAPASATAYQSASINSGGTSVGGNNIAISVASCTFAFTSTNLTSQQLSDFTVRVNGTVVSPVAGNYVGSFINLGLASNLSGGAQISVAYTVAHTAITCANGTDTVGTFSAVTLTLSSSPSLLSGPTATSVNGVITATPASWNVQPTNLVVRWNLCGMTMNADNSTSVTFYQPSCQPLFTAQTSGAYKTGTTLDTNGTFYVYGGGTYSLAVFPGSFVVYVETGDNGFASAHSLTMISNGGGGGGGGGSTYTNTSPASYSIANNVATANDGTWSGGTPTRYWILCNNPHNAPSTSIHMDCFPLALTQNGSDERGTTVNLATTVWMGFSGTRTQVNFADKYFGLYVQNGSSQYITATSAGPAGAAVAPRVLSLEQAKNQIKPLPVIVQPLVAALPSLSKPMVDAGGKVALTAGDFTGLVSASISGKVLDITVGSTGGLTITVPNGQAGKTADLLLNFTSGTVILQDAIKYVAPVVVANVPVRPVAIKAGAKTLSPAAADSVRQAAFANLNNNSIECVGYAASAAGSAAAEATAQQACALAVKSNPDLVNTNVVVVIDAKKAATQGVGIKVYKK